MKASGVIGEDSDSFPIVEEIKAKKRGIRCAVYIKLLKLTQARRTQNKLFNKSGPLTLEVPEILPYLEVPSGVKLTLLFIDAFYIF